MAEAQPTEEELLTMHKRGHSFQTLADKYALSLPTIRKYITIAARGTNYNPINQNKRNIQKERSRTKLEAVLILKEEQKIIAQKELEKKKDLEAQRKERMLKLELEKKKLDLIIEEKRIEAMKLRTKLRESELQAREITRNRIDDSKQISAKNKEEREQARQARIETRARIKDANNRGRQKELPPFLTDPKLAIYVAIEAYCRIENKLPLQIITERKIPCENANEFAARCTSWKEAYCDHPQFEDMINEQIKENEESDPIENMVREDLANGLTLDQIREKHGFTLVSPAIKQNNEISLEDMKRMGMIEDDF